jgi:uncharacterized repeat protein (TIGR03803 family)
MYSSRTNNRTEDRLNILFAAAIRGALTLAVLSALLLIAAHPVQAQTETVLYNFKGYPGDGAHPAASLILDEKGDLYGTTDLGGEYGLGTVFEWTATGTEKVLYSFGSQSGDGSVPAGGLIFDKENNLYGTAATGGAFGYGAVFELTATGVEKILYSFGGQPGDGATPVAGLIFDKKGNLYGTTEYGGAHAYGTIFELSAAGTEKVLYSFGSQSGDGTYPVGLIFDTKSNLYGTTIQGGDLSCGYGGCGTIFELTKAGTEKVLYSFSGYPGDGDGPSAGLIFDKKGDLYGTTEYGGTYNCIGHGCGTVFELTAAGTEKVLYSFGSQSDDGNYPVAGLNFDKKGNLYGTTYASGSYNYGTVFELTAAGTEKVLYSFGDFLGDGANPEAGLIFDKEGNLYGTTVYVSDHGYGNIGYGTVFKLTFLTATSTALTSSLNPSTAGEKVTFTATVTPAPPDGETVAFMDGSTEMGTGTLSSGSATYSTSALPVGKSTITAVYGGDEDFAASTSKAVKQTVKK